MTTLEIVLNVLSMVFIEISVSMIITHLYPKFKKKEIDLEENASQLKHVKMDKMFKSIFVVLAILSNIIGIVIFAFPSIIIAILGFNYLITIIVWWLPLIFSNAILYLLFTEAKYNDKGIFVKKVFSKEKFYKYDDILSYSETGNLKVKTTKGSFVLLNAMAGTNSLRKILKSKRQNLMADKK